MSFDIKKYKKIIALSLFFALYLVVLWLCFTAKGISADGHFYRKSANLTTVTYTCRNPFAKHRQIVLNKQMDHSVITVDGVYTITVSPDGSWQQTDSTGETVMPDTDWVSIARQKAETTRGNAKKQPYFVVFIVYILFAASKLFSPRVYEFFFKGKAAGEGYYKAFDLAFTLVTAAVLIYFILPL